LIFAESTDVFSRRFTKRVARILKRVIRKGPFARMQNHAFIFTAKSWENSPKPAWSQWPVAANLSDGVIKKHELTAPE